MLRLFETGKREEERVYRNLRSIGIEVNESQFYFKKFGGHFAGSCDGALLGHPDAPKTWHLIEIKTHSLKSFNYLKENGVKKAKPEHLAQMQVYMNELGLTRALYFAVCKNDDQIYTERIELNKKEAEKLKEKAKTIIESAKAPKKIGNTHDSCFDCIYCDYKSACHRLPDNDLLPSLSCRTCIHSSARTEEGDWYCEARKISLKKRRQRFGCDQHLFLPELVPAELVDAKQDKLTYLTNNGRQLINRIGKGFND